MGEKTEGAVAVIDALGFKGIWERVTDPRDVISTLREAKRSAEQDEQWFNDALSAPGAVRVRLFSDTAVITCVAGVETARKGPLGPKEAVLSVARAATAFISLATLRKVPLVYRGCISFGPLLVEDDFFVGRAVDEAAEWERKADAAVVWLLPSALAAVDGFDETKRFGFVRWDVPIKGSGSFNTLILNPMVLFRHLDDMEPEEIVQKYLAPFGERDRMDLAVKRQNTERALRFALAQTPKKPRGEE